MKIFELIQDFKTKKIQNTKADSTVISGYLKKTLEIKTYLPFLEKKKLVDMIIDANITEENGIKKDNQILRYISFITTSITAHTGLEFEDVFADYDALAESGLLEHVVAEFASSHNELDVMMKMALADKMADNNLSAVVARFLDGILDKVDDITGPLGEKIDGLNIEKLLGNINKEDVTKLIGFVDKLKK